MQRALEAMINKPLTQKNLLFWICLLCSLCLFNVSHAEEDIDITLSPIEYFELQYPNLQKNNEWYKIIFLGKEAAEYAEHQGLIRGVATVHANLAATYFYLGEYQQVLKHAISCQNFAFQDETASAISVKAWYLLSAAHRAMGGEAIDSLSKSVCYRKAVEASQESLKLYNEFKLTDANLKGKIFFNLGAAHADNPEGSNQEAITCYEKAMKLYESEGNQFDYYRTALRFARAKMLENELDATAKILESLKDQKTSIRNMMHFEYLAAQYFAVLKKHDASQKSAFRALEHAKKLSAKADIKRILNFITEAHFKS